MIEFADAAMSLVGALAWQRPAELMLPCRVEMLDATGLRSIDAEQWDGLASDALEDNPWLSRQMVLAGLDAFGAEVGLRALALYRHGSDQLIGLLPFRVRGAGAMGVGKVALNIYQVAGTPLVAREHAQLAMMGLFGVMAQAPGLPRHWVFPHVAAESAFIEMARTKARRLGLELGMAATYRRPVLTRAAGDFAGHVAGVIGRKRAKDIERNLRRLAKEGEVRFERVNEPAPVAQRVEDFLAIEAAGWKGKRGTALLSCPADADFARRAFGGRGAGQGLASVDSLLLDGMPIAVSVNIAAGATLFTPKCAFDERYRKFGPGMALEYMVIEAFFAGDRYERMDAATTVDGHVIGGLWGETRTMGTLVVGPAGMTTRTLVAGIDAVARGKRAIKRVLGRG
ncbi:GNAT family N-acetyltransferase [Pelagibacterium sp. 26DY04]|uniref:GNAT family N-acetyltransferase n=1 Tax=Pelagibacterium sp. 26DY04 TaxID=2967130 RepID=UPI002815A782|nr:GNAT family N-acetyltransferase [Pelagibacterium sp. 26DY04]WMT86680.1 GNAT family N-acetyltransferase [Pelagibacterium sp. 26DY04]